jgi:hypothetical protein
VRGEYDSAGNWVGAGSAYQAGNGYDRRDGVVTGYYSNGRWVAGETTGRYDANGRWISGPPSGRRDANGRWIADDQPGYHDRYGRWIAGRVRGEYDSAGNWVGAGSAYQAGNGYDQRDGVVPGYYDNGRWIAGPTTGRYDNYGRWIAGTPAGRRDANGRWVSDAQPGYYDSNGRWQRGMVNGSYDNQGRWTSYGQTNYNQNGQPTAAERYNRIEQRIDRGIRDGSLNRTEAQNARNELASIRRFDRSKRQRNGRISASNAAQIDLRLDRLSQRVRLDRNDNG